jgi:hypothetical protein
MSFAVSGWSRLPSRMNTLPDGLASLDPTFVTRTRSGTSGCSSRIMPT